MKAMQFNIIYIIQEQWKTLCQIEKLPNDDVSFPITTEYSATIRLI